jgi:hypothetical protein
MKETLSTEDMWRLFILSKGSTLESGEKGIPKLAIQVEYVFQDEKAQKVFEDLLLKDWLRLIDVAPIAISNGKLMKIYRVMPEAIKWYNATKEKYNR